MYVMLASQFRHGSNLRSLESEVRGRKACEDWKIQTSDDDDDEHLLARNLYRYKSTRKLK